MLRACSLVAISPRLNRRRDAAPRRAGVWSQRFRSGYRFADLLIIHDPFLVCQRDRTRGGPPPLCFFPSILSFFPSFFPDAKRTASSKRKDFVCFKQVLHRILLSKSLHTARQSTIGIDSGERASGECSCLAACLPGSVISSCSPSFPPFLRHYTKAVRTNEGTNERDEKESVHARPVFIKPLLTSRRCRVLRRRRRCCCCRRELCYRYFVRPALRPSARLSVCLSVCLLVGCRWVTGTLSCS